MFLFKLNHSQHAIIHSIIDNVHNTSSLEVFQGKTAIILLHHIEIPLK